MATSETKKKLFAVERVFFDVPKRKRQGQQQQQQHLETVKRQVGRDGLTRMNSSKTTNLASPGTKVTKRRTLKVRFSEMYQLQAFVINSGLTLCDVAGLVSQFISRLGTLYSDNCSGCEAGWY